MQINTTYQVILTRHAIERAKQFSLTIPQAVALFRSGIQENLDKNMKKHKKGKYDDPDVFYWRSDSFVFVCKEEIHKRTKQPIYLIITLTNQLINTPPKGFPLPDLAQMFING